MHDPVTMWHREHMRFARLLDFVEKEMKEFHFGGQPDYELMRDAVHYLQHYANRFHHPREDVAFGRMVERYPDKQVAIARLLQEHRVIDVAGAQLLVHLEAILEDTIVPRDRIEAAAATYLLYYRHHLATEEAEILPLAADLLTPEDWAAVAAAVPAGPDPLFGSDISARYCELYAQIGKT
ncbi:MAG: hemerythrin domain-containing protein [Betaproteobacteria bacterium]